ncbi:sigma-70 family RNA polymerase sigma factor [Streptomyces sp. NPDC005494]|uniref:RNA polymerase sigma factor n=1 Tax=Streptomyces sp. NPDC005494 TaxID=3364715 RepID=UPI0036AF64B8
MRNRYPARPRHSPGNRWELVWSHREELLEIARRRSSSDEEAEDAVHEAMLRAVEDPDVQYGRIGPWLRLATVRACAERHRQIARDSELARSLPAPVEPCQVEEAACDRAEAQWLADRGMELLPARQAEALRLRSRDLDVGQVARTLGLSYRATESLLARARRSLRDALAGSLAVAVTVWMCVRRFPGTGATRSAVATSAATVAVAGLFLPAPSPGLPDTRPPRAGAPPAATAEGLPSPRTTPHRAHAPSPSTSPAPGSDPRTGQDTARPVAGEPQTTYEATDPTALGIRVGSISLTTKLPPPAVPTSIPSLPVNTSGPVSVEAPVELPTTATGESGGHSDPPSANGLDILGE